MKEVIKADLVAVVRVRKWMEAITDLGECLFLPSMTIAVLARLSIILTT